MTHPNDETNYQIHMLERRRLTSVIADNILTIRTDTHQRICFNVYLEHQYTLQTNHTQSSLFLSRCTIFFAFIL